MVKDKPFVFIVCNTLPCRSVTIAFFLNRLSLTVTDPFVGLGDYTLLRLAVIAQRYELAIGKLAVSIYLFYPVICSGCQRLYLRKRIIVFAIAFAIDASNAAVDKYHHCFFSPGSKDK